MTSVHLLGCPFIEGNGIYAILADSNADGACSSGE